MEDSCHAWKRDLLSLLIVMMTACLTASAQSAATRYATHSVLRSGTWVKIRIPETGIYQLSDELLRNAGFSTYTTGHHGIGRLKGSSYMHGEWPTAVSCQWPLDMGITHGKRAHQKPLFRLWLLLSHSVKWKPAKRRQCKFCIVLSQRPLLHPLFMRKG